MMVVDSRIILTTKCGIGYVHILVHGFHQLVYSTEYGGEREEVPWLQRRQIRPSC